MSSISESFGLVLIEAMSCGLPTISYACPTGPLEIISNEKDGYLIPINDEKELAKKINLLITNESQRKIMGHNALLKAKSFSVERIINKYMELFLELSKQ